jgi:TolA-binding protein
MRFHLITILLIGIAATPAAAQRDPVEQRVNRLEQEMRAVQRRVFPDGRAQFVEPEIRPQAPSGPAGVPAGDAISNLNARVDALESQLRSLTGQIEENDNRTRQLEREMTRLRSDLEGRLDRAERQAMPAEPPPIVPPTRPAPAAPAPASTAPTGSVPDDPEEAYNAGFRLWNAGQHAEAQRALEAAAARHPNTRWTSWMRNLQGRAALDQGQPATAARILLANYQDNPRGERAADSLFFLGQALTRLNRRPEACRVYDELAQVYPNMREFIRTRLPQARADARCSN